MNQFTLLYQRLSWAQRIWIVVAAAAVIGGLMQFARWNEERDFKPLYTNLAAEDAGTLTAKLKEAGVDYRLGEGGGTILVPSARVAEARLAMAAQGLPKSGRIGFELFDKANFGASEFAEQVNYHRAIEGELERTVMAVHEVEQARVHVTLAKESLYSEVRQPAKASILVKLHTGARLSPQNISAICQLAANAVPELSPDQVALVDTNGNLLNRAKRPGMAEADGGEAELDYRKSVEKDLQNKIAATLEPILGTDHFRVGVSAEIDLTSADQSEETYDPQKSAIVSSQTSQDGPGLPAASGVPGSASNLPRATASTAPASAGASNYARKTESVSYQPSRLIRHTKLPQGGVTKLSLSVLLDHGLRWEGNKKIVEPPTAQKLQVIRDLVTAAAGLDMERGDQLVVEAFPFEATLSAEPNTIAPPAAPPARFALPLPPWLQRLVDTKNFLLIAGIGGATFLLLTAGGLFFLLKLGKKKRIAAQATAAIASAGAEHSLAPSAEELEKQMEARLAEQASLQARQDAEELMKLKLPVVATKKTEILTKHIAAETKKDPTVMAQVVRSWLTDGKRQ